MTAVAVATSPTGRGHRSMHMLLTGRNGAAPWKDAERACKHCGGEFLPAREEQAFCPGGECRVAWWKEHRKDVPHTCICGDLHQPVEPPSATAPRLQPRSWGALFLRYCEAAGIQLSGAARAELLADLRAVAPSPVGRCTRPYCRGFMLLDWDDEPRCQLCGRTDRDALVAPTTCCRQDSVVD